MQRPEQQAGCSFSTQCQWTGALLKLPFTNSSDPTMIGITVSRFCHNLESSMARSSLLLLLLLFASYCVIVYILVGSGGFLRTVKSSVTSIWKESKALKDRYDCITFLCVAIFNLFIFILGIL